jgi:hypothetical protein
MSPKSEDHLTTPPLIKLIGDEQENFYQLGLKDKEGHQLLLDHALGLFKTPWKLVNISFQEILKSIVTPCLELQPSFKRRIEAYSEGLGRRPSEIALAYLIPEMMCFMDKWLPGLPHTMLGCSSTFTWCSKRDALVHGRVLDFPFLGSFDQEERAMMTQLSGGPKTLSFSSSGVCYPSITAMTENGVTVALHQKFGSTFNYKGTPIFEMVYNLLQNVSTIDEAIKFLKKSTSLTTWSLYMGFKDGKVLEAELDGDQLFYKIHQATPDKLLYFCNERFQEKDRLVEAAPYGFQHFNEMRKCSAEKKIKLLNKGAANWNAEKVLKLQGFALEQKIENSKNWEADTLTPSSLQNICMVPATGEALSIPGEAPKFFNGKAWSIKEAFSAPQSSLVNIKGKTNSTNYQKGLKHFMRAQVAHDKSDIHAIYHNIQLAIDYFTGDSYQRIAEFYFLVFQYIHEDHRKTLSATLNGFKELDGKLPAYLNDHCTLFIARLEKIISGNTTVGIDEIQNLNLQRIYDFEMKMPRLLFHRATRELMAPRLELLDIFYPHVKAK